MPEHTLSSLIDVLAERDLQLVGFTVDDGIDAMLAYYSEIAGDVDRLVYRWGLHDRGDGERFELDIRRQLVTGEIAMTFLYRPTAGLRLVGEGERACESPDERDQLLAFIRSTAAYVVATTTPIERIELEYSSAA